MVPYLRLERNDIELMSYDLASTGMFSVSKIWKPLKQSKNWGENTWYFEPFLFWDVL